MRALRRALRPQGLIHVHMPVVPLACSAEGCDSRRVAARLYRLTAKRAGGRWSHTVTIGTLRQRISAKEACVDMVLQYAVQLRPTQFLKDAVAGTPTPWILNLDRPANGLNVPVTDWATAADLLAAGVSTSDIETALEAITEQLENASDGTVWKVTSDGGAKAVSMPQQGVEPATLNSWFLNLCCLQGTLGQIAAQFFSYPALAVYRSKLFPKLQRKPYAPTTDNLGAWQIQLDTAPAAPLTRQEAVAARSRIIREIDSWTLVLIEQDTPNAPSVPVLWPQPAALAQGTGLVFRPQLDLLPPSIYPPMGEKCDEENRRPVRPFPPGACAPPFGGGANGCYFPVRNYPSCCFSRINFPLGRAWS